MSATPSLAQAPVPSGTWVAAGLGVGRFSDESSPAMNLEIAHQEGAHLFTAWTSAVFEIFDDDVWDLGILYGRTNPDSDGFLAISAGLSLVDALTDCGGLFTAGECLTEKTIGVPIVVATSLRPTSFVGVALRGFVNLNTIDSYAGFTLGLEVGKLSHAGR